MSDYLDQIAVAKADVARLKGEKEAFEQSNEPDDADEEELKNWNYAKDLERQIRELKAENRDALKELAKLEKAAARSPSPKRKLPPLAGGGKGEGVCLQTARDSIQPVLDQIAALEAALAPYEQIKRDLAAARARFRKLTDEFVSELKNRCGFMGDDKKRALVLELLEQDIHAGLDGALNEKRQVLVHFIQAMWDKYAVPLGDIILQREQLMGHLRCSFEELGYTRPDD
jgi:type I restriction enzyme M protein